MKIITFYSINRVILFLLYEYPKSGLFLAYVGPKVKDQEVTAWLPPLFQNPYINV